jgi:hypothetical protein
MAGSPIEKIYRRHRCVFQGAPQMLRSRALTAKFAKKTRKAPKEQRFSGVLGGTSLRT